MQVTVFQGEDSQEASGTVPLRGRGKRTVPMGTILSPWGQSLFEGRRYLDFGKNLSNSSGLGFGVSRLTTTSAPREAMSAG